MPVTVEISDTLYRKLDSKNLLSAMRKAVTETTIKLEGECKDYAPWDTGYLMKQHSYYVDGGSEKIRAMVKNGANYWMYVEYGTRYAPAQGYIQRAIEVTEPESDVIKRFKTYYKPGE